MTISNIAVRQITCDGSGNITWGNWSTSLTDFWSGSRGTNYKHVAECRFRVSEPCNKITLTVRAYASNYTGYVYWKYSPVESDETLAKASYISGQAYDAYSYTNSEYGTTTVTINGNFPANTDLYLYGFNYAAGNAWSAVHMYALYNLEFYTKVTAATAAPAYRLAISAGTGTTITAELKSSPYNRRGALSNGATIYAGEVLNLTYLISAGYILQTATVNGASFTNGTAYTVTGNLSVIVTASYAKSDVSASNGTFGFAVPITITRYSNDYTHTLTVTCAGYTETIATRTSTYPTIEWVPAVATYAPLITTATSAIAIITCETFSDNTSVGTTSARITLSFNVSDIKPSTSISLTDPNGYYPKYEAYVATKSKLEVTLSNTLKYGASVKSITITANGSTYSSSPATTNALSANANTVTARIIDSRGIQSDLVSQNITILSYAPPTIGEFSVHRSEEDGAANDLGKYCRVDYSVAVAPLNSINGKALTLRYRQVSETTWQSISVALSEYTQSDSIVIAVSTESSYSVQLVLSDDFATTTLTTSLSTAGTTVDYKARGKGVAFGKVAEHDYLADFAWPIAMNGNKVTGLGTPTDSSDAVPLGYADRTYAPGGYGLGVAHANVLTSKSKLDAAMVNGWHYYQGETISAAGVNFTNALVRVSGQDRYNVIQEVFPASSIARLVRYAAAGTWTEWHIDNPPMYVGVEYRTTEQYNGKAVYTRLINGGSLTNGLKVICPNDDNYQGCIRYAATVDGYGVPAASGLASYYANVFVEPTEGGHKATFYSNGTLDGLNVYIQFWYVKS